MGYHSLSLPVSPAAPFAPSRCAVVMKLASGRAQHPPPFFLFRSGLMMSRNECLALPAPRGLHLPLQRAYCLCRIARLCNWKVGNIAKGCVCRPGHSDGEWRLTRLKPKNKKSSTATRVCGALGRAQVLQYYARWLVLENVLSDGQSRNRTPQLKHTAIRKSGAF